MMAGICLLFKIFEVAKQQKNMQTLGATPCMDKDDSQRSHISNLARTC